MSFTNQSIDAKLAASQLALSNAATIPKIGSLLIEFGYDAALDGLDEWMSDFIAIARIALKGTQLSEALGILERS